MAGVGDGQSGGIGAGGGVGVLDRLPRSGGAVAEGPLVAGDRRAGWEPEPSSVTGTPAVVSCGSPALAWSGTDPVVVTWVSADPVSPDVSVMDAPTL